MEIFKPALPDSRPTLLTERLLLRPFNMADAKQVQLLAGHAKVAATTAVIPHPYPDGAAEDWISRHAEWFQKGFGVQFAIVLKQTNELIGCIDLSGLSKVNSKAELGYWIGVDHWNKGYCSEAAKAIMNYGFESLGLNKITARHIIMNPASGSVMLKAGMKKEGLLRQETYKNGHHHDVAVYGILKEEH